jgi:Putative transposase
VLHTWTQEMKLHVHLHLVVTAGGLDPSGSRWIPCRRNFLVPNRALAKLVRGKLCDAIENAHEKDPLRLPDPLAAPDAFRRLLRKARRTKWIAYSKAPFAGPEPVFLYLGQYTHRVAISNHRLIDVSEGQVTFSARDNETPGARRTVRLPAGEFLDRFLLHVLPDRFVRIRHYGLLASRNLPTKLPLARRLIQSQGSACGVEAPASPNAPRPRSWQAWLERLTGIDPTRCPRCKTAPLLRFALPRSTTEAAFSVATLRAAHDTS